MTFQVHVNTNYGEQVWVCGSDDALGSWIPSKGVQVLCRSLRCSFTSFTSFTTRRRARQLDALYGCAGAHLLALLALLLDDALGSWMPSKGVQALCLLPLLVQKDKC
jgi:hypothetical protein